MNNTTDDSLTELVDWRPSPILYFVLACVFLLALFFTLVTNTVTVVVMVTTPKLRTRTNAFIVSLAVSDILFALYFIIIVSLIASINRVSISSTFLWMVAELAWEVQVLGSYGNLLMVSLERWLYIAKPFLYQRYVTKGAVIGSITVTWIITIGGIFPYIIFGSVNYSSIDVFTPTLHTAYFFVIVAMYTHICHITLKHLKKLPKASQQAFHLTGRNGDRPKENKTLSRHVENWKSIKLLISICGIFFLFLSPYVYYKTYTYTNFFKTQAAMIWYMICFVLSTLFHCSNFFVYALGIPLFRKTLRKQFCRLRCCRGSQIGKGRDTSIGSTLGMETEKNIVLVN